MCASRSREVRAVIHDQVARGRRTDGYGILAMRLVISHGHQVRHAGPDDLVYQVVARDLRSELTS